jgi:diacylglycerol O-acyltransferase / wax synthase
MNEHLSPIESIMWRIGQDPTLRMTVGALMLLDRSPTAAALGDRLSSAIEHAPQLRQRPDDPTFTRTRPAWIDDPDLHLGHHLRSVAIASPGTLRQVLDLVGLFEAIPFDPERPPWDVTLIEGIEDGRAALYFRAHHCLTDGLGGIRLVGALLDEVGWPDHLRTEREATERTSDDATDRTSDDAAPSSDRRRGTITIDLTRAAQPLRRRLDAARDTEALDTVVRGFQRALDVANSVSRQVMVTGGPLSPLFLDHSMMSRFEVLSIPLARESSLALGGSRNDLLVAGAASGLGLYHERMGQPSPHLRLATPAGQGRGHEVGGNWFAPARVEVPTGAGHPGPHFGMVAERLAQARGEPALRLTTALAWTIGRLPTRLLLPALHAQADAVDFAATAFPGLRGRRHICGSLVEATYPFGPRLGCPVNFTALGNDDRLDLGVALDPAAITKTDVFLESLTEAFDSFVSAAQRNRRSTTPSGSC